MLGMQKIVKILKWIRCKLILFPKKNIQLGQNSTFGRGTVFYAPNETTIAHNVYIGKYCSLETDITIGTEVVIGNNVGMVGKYDHDYSYIGKTIKNAPWIGDGDYNFKGKNQKLIIERDVWIGYGSVLLSGITVGKGSIVAAGSVVTKNVEPYAIVAGNPAKKVGNRFTMEEIVKHEASLDY